RVQGWLVGGAQALARGSAQPNVHYAGAKDPYLPKSRDSPLCPRSCNALFPWAHHLRQGTCRPARKQGRLLWTPRFARDSPETEPPSHHPAVHPPYQRWSFVHPSIWLDLREHRAKCFRLRLLAQTE